MTAAVAFLERHSLVIAIGLSLLASARIVATYTAFNHTFDEPMHIACGMEWLDKGTYTCEPQHPPLARVAAALGPYLSGIRSQGIATTDLYTQPREGVAILYSGHHYGRTLALARLGILPFFWIACAVVYGWAAWYFGKAMAALAVFLFSFTPAVLAHAGLATTDMPLTAMLGAAFLSGLVWVERPTVKRAAVFGVCTGLAILSKFTTLAFLPAAALVAFIWYWATGGSGLGKALRERAATLLMAAGAAVVIVWAGYRFSFGPVDFTSLHLPAPALYAGIENVIQHNDRGHWSYLLGERSPLGFWYFYPVALLFKTPLALLVLTLFGAVLAFRKGAGLLWIPLCFAGAILQVAVLGHINIGIRHVLPMYMGMAILAAAGVLKLLQAAVWHRAAGIAVAALLVWLAASSLLGHPDYIAYFNELAGSHPEKILVDSDLDWGQDIKRAAARLHQLGVKEVMFPQFIVADLENEHGFPRLNSNFSFAEQPDGYFLAGATFWKAFHFGLPADQKLWMDSVEPTERIGRGMFLWYRPPEKR
ncbi:MAG TPA: glycosyltransferase family 39 protein [Bryobacteraceae bacterium]|nr:glycosyltransferase family 39 protein [Bryobacteraceae bacterium]